MFKFEMGATVTQNNSRYVGVIVARCEFIDYINYQVRSANLSSDGEPVEVWIGEGDLA
jgi:hypothetical protein